MSVILETTIGDITVDLHVEQRPRGNDALYNQQRSSYESSLFFQPA